MTRWISTDIATSSGAVVWEGTEPVWLVRVWPNTKKTVWQAMFWPVVDDHGTRSLRPPVVQKFPSDQEAWEAVWSLTYGGYKYFVTESVYGPGAEVLAERRGTILVYLGCRAERTPVLKARPQDWRGAAVMGTGLEWPPGRDLKKAFSVQLVQAELGVKLVDDVADAYLIGKWFLVKELYESQRDEARDRSQQVQRGGGAGRPKSGRGRFRKRGGVVRRPPVRPQPPLLSIAPSLNGRSKRQVPSGVPALLGKARKRGRPRAKGGGP